MDGAAGSEAVVGVVGPAGSRRAGDPVGRQRPVRDVVPHWRPPVQRSADGGVSIVVLEISAVERRAGPLEGCGVCEAGVFHDLSPCGCRGEKGVEREAEEEEEEDAEARRLRGRH